MRQGDLRIWIFDCRFSNIAIFLLLAGVCFGRYSGGNGEPNTPYLIGTAADLNDIGNNVGDFSKCFVMINDINMAEYSGTEYKIIGDTSNAFKGIFDGNDHTISNLSINVTRSEVGLFGFVGQKGIIQNTNLKNIDYKGSDYVGGITGGNSGDILNCSVSGIIEGNDDCGGIIGSYRLSMYQIQILKCSFEGKVRGNRMIGGIIGGLSSTRGIHISECYAIADINGVGDCGGVVGFNSGGNLSRCFAKGAILCSGSSAGGIAGRTMDECGIGGQIYNCYADVIVNCSNKAGGLIGEIYYSGQVVNSFFLESSGPDNGYGEPLTSEQMRTRSTFTDAGWDFVGEVVNGTEDFWDICDGTNYPKLSWQQAGVADFGCPDGVDGIDYSYFASRWGEENCGDSNDCDGVDFDFSGVVDWGDFRVFCGQWLEGGL
ncbi:MAG: hypothetical protein ACYSWP_04700 [Planctomycetota bacterium]|jgi:hypothetical protein